MVISEFCYFYSFLISDLSVSNSDTFAKNEKWEVGKKEVKN